MNWIILILAVFAYVSWKVMLDEWLYHRKIKKQKKSFITKKPRVK
jgi:hypothetical protein